MRKYFVYELKKNIFIISALTLAATVFYVAPISLFLPYAGKPSSSGTYLWVISTIGGLLAALVPVWLLSYKMKKRSVDLYYSLPLSHVKILAVKFFVGLLAVFIPYTVSYWLGAFSAMALSRTILENAVYYVPQFFASIIPVYFIYSISAFVFTQANSTWDGLAFILFWTFALPLVMTILNELTEHSVEITEWDYVTDQPYISYSIFVYINPYRYYAFAPLDFVTSRFQEYLAGNTNIAYGYNAVSLANLITGFTITTLTSAGATAGLFLFERRAKAENVAQPSESWFGYKVMIPLFTVCLLGICSIAILSVIIIVCAFFLTVAYKRTFKIGKIQAIILPMAVAIGLILNRFI